MGACTRDGFSGVGFFGVLGGRNNTYTGVSPRAAVGFLVFYMVFAFSIGMGGENAICSHPIHVRDSTHDGRWFRVRALSPPSLGGGKRVGPKLFGKPALGGSGKVYKGATP